MQVLTSITINSSVQNILFHVFNSFNLRHCVVIENLSLFRFPPAADFVSENETKLAGTDLCASSVSLVNSKLGTPRWPNKRVYFYLGNIIYNQNSLFTYLKVQPLCYTCI